MDEDQEGVKLDMRQTVVECCALNEEGQWVDGRKGMNKRVSWGVLETERGLQKKEKERESGGWTRIKRVYAPALKKYTGRV